MASPDIRSHFRPGQKLIAFTLAVVALAVLTPALGCGAFFVYPGSSSATATSCTAASTTTNTNTIYGYIANSTCGDTYLNGYILSAGTLVSATSAPYNTGIVPQAIAITYGNAYMYIADDSAVNTGDIFGWSIGTGGAISILNGGSPLVADNVTAMDVSPDGKNLFALNADGLTLDQYTINSGGTLSLVTNYSLVSASGAAIVPTSLKFAPSGDFVVVGLGTGGADIFQYSTSTATLVGTGVSVAPVGYITVATGAGINGVSVDANGYVYATVSNASGGSLSVFSTTTTGVPTLLKSYTAGNGPHGVVVNPASTYVYVANFADSTISEFSIGSNGALTAVSGSPVNAPSNVLNLGVTSGGGYLVANGYNGTNGIQVFSIGSGGALTLTASTGSGTNTAYPAVLGLTR